MEKEEAQGPLNLRCSHFTLGNYNSNFLKYKNEILKKKKKFLFKFYF